MNIAWIAIELPFVGERQILVKDEQNLQLGQQVVIECVPNPEKPDRHMFRMAGGLDADSNSVRKLSDARVEEPLSNGGLSVW